MMKVGILGTANIARKNILAMQACEGVEAVCVGSRDLARAKAFASETGLAGVLNGEFVCVCVPACWLLACRPVFLSADSREVRCLCSPSSVHML